MSDQSYRIVHSPRIPAMIAKAVMVAVLLFGGGQLQAAGEDSELVQKIYSGVAFRLFEHGHDGVHAVPPGARVPADIGSDLHLEMMPLKTDQNPPDDSWGVFKSQPATVIQVTVQAFLDGKSGKRTVLHVGGYDGLPLGNLNSIWHHPLNMPGVRIELDKTKWSLGDRVSVVLRVRDEKTQEVLFSGGWRVNAHRTGLHSRYSASLIFSRTVHGTPESQRWRPNVMAQVNWFDDLRNPGKFGTAWNWMGIGAGLHLASLDHGTDTVEFGMGINIALWDGLLSFGYGRNLSLSSDDGEYRFVGLNLFDTLNKAK